MGARQQARPATPGRLGRATGWQVVAVPGLLPEQVFFTHLANRRFPVTVWLRDEHEFDYIVEPDVFLMSKLIVVSLAMVCHVENAAVQRTHSPFSSS